MLSITAHPQDLVAPTGCIAIQSHAHSNTGPDLHRPRWQLFKRLSQRVADIEVPVTDIKQSTKDLQTKQLARLSPLWVDKIKLGNTISSKKGHTWLQNSHFHKLWCKTRGWPVELGHNAERNFESQGRSSISDKPSGSGKM
ncbi:hypothetical protein OIU84_023751 [Salix udensis]|uniref:Uncharacterized protein n=1 Tax=Salix udensis TaxID=889485 RepID=A0AAD6PHA9_9ROSI|nr:hypothetical protein OIU84_023751 [Salix udensis]